MIQLLRETVQRCFYIKVPSLECFSITMPFAFNASFWLIISEDLLYFPLTTMKRCRATDLSRAGVLENNTGIFSLLKFMTK